MNTDTLSTSAIPPCNHTSVGMVVWSLGGRLLLQQRAKPPYGIACPAGHVEEGETYRDAARRELEEETGLHVVQAHLLYKGRFDNPCRRPDGTYHYWHVYHVRTDGVLVPNKEEVRAIDWYTLDDVRDLAQRTEAYQQGAINDNDWMDQPGLEPIWYTLLSLLQIV